MATTYTPDELQAAAEADRRGMRDGEDAEAFTAEYQSAAEIEQLAAAAADQHGYSGIVRADYISAYVYSFGKAQVARG